MKRTRTLFPSLAISMAVLMLSLSPFSATAATLDSIRASVISSDLRESIAAGDASEYMVMVSLTNDELDSYAQSLVKETTSIQESTRANIDSTGSLEEIQAQISRQRAESRAFYQAQNQAIIDKAVDPEDVIYVSRYTPMAILDLSATEINQLALNREIESISSIDSKQLSQLDENLSFDSVNETIAPYSSTNTATNYKTMVRASSLTNYATGSGIVIGMVETGIPTDYYLEYLNVTDYYFANNVVKKDHTDQVACMIRQFAPNSELYCASIGTGYTYTSQTISKYVECIEWLLDNNVNVINASVSMRDSYNYTMLSRWTEHIISYHAVTFIVAVGSNDINQRVTSTAASYNSIAIGAVDSTGELYDVSAYNSMFATTATKPDICAPGVGIVLDNFDYSNISENSSTGTSISAPIVTGIVALMMQRNPDLIFEPEAIKALLTANVNSVYARHTTEKTSDNPYRQYGAGIVDCNRLYASLRSGRYESALPGSANEGHTISYTVRIPKIATTRMSLAYSYDFDLSSCDYIDDYTGVITPDLPNIEMEVWIDGQCIASTVNDTNNVKILELASCDEERECTVKIVFQEDAENSVFVGFAWNFY